jgi:hypothetical protein
MADLLRQRMAEKVSIRKKIGPRKTLEGNDSTCHLNYGNPLCLERNYGNARALPQETTVKIILHVPMIKNMVYVFSFHSFHVCAQGNGKSTSFNKKIS